MSYLAFALKYRPQDFEQVVGQQHVVSSLQGAIAKKRIHHAYLFSGPRGVGKTSLARILAKALNCREGPTTAPCLRCPSCVDIAAGKSLDIIEIDGASNRGIDEIRSLRENIKLMPASGRFKVYIIDEVHMLTKEAFNALLKTLEEPPKHVKFIFATTDPHKVLPTILSRCQKFQFNLLTLEQITAKLKEIAKAEKLKIDESFLYTIAQAAEGSIRDAESLLDQILPVISSGEDVKDIFSFLGIIDENSLNKIIGFLSTSDLPAILDSIDKAAKQGKDLGVFLDHLLKYLRNLLIAKINPGEFAKTAEISPQSRDFIVKVVAGLPLAEILKLIDLLIKAKEISRQIHSARIPFELAFIKFLHKKNKSDNNINGEGGAKPGENKNSSIIEQKENKPERAPEAEEEKQELPARPQAENGGREDVFEDDILIMPVKAKWKEIIAGMQKERMAVASHFSFGKPVSSAGKQVFVSFLPQDKFHKETLDTEKNRKFIEDSIKAVINKEVRIKLKVDNRRKDELRNPGSENNDRGGESKPAKGRIKDQFLNELLDAFDGKFHNSDE